MKLAIFSSIAFLPSGGIAASPDIEVRREVDNALQPLFSDANGVTPITNPFTGDANGRFNFYCVASQDGFKVKVTKGGDTYTLRNVRIGSVGYLDATDLMIEFLLSGDRAAARGVLGVLGGPVESRAANDMLSADDDGKIILATASFTQTLDAASTLDNSWAVGLRINAGVTLVIDPDGAELVDEGATKTLVGPTSGFLHCDGSNFYTIGFPTSGEPMFEHRFQGGF